MLLFEIIFTVFSTLLLYLVCFWRSRKHLQIICLLVCLVVLLIHLIFESARWQMSFCYLTFVLTAVMIPGQNRFHLVLRILGFALGILLISTSSFYAITMPIIDLPAPSGSLQVGTTNFTLVDKSREELHTDSPNDNRELFIEVWYPADLDQSSKLPRPRSLWQELYHGKLDRISFFMNYLKNVATHSYPGATPKPAGQYPLVLFNHGLQMFTSQNTLLMEHLASHGYVVVSIGHPYESLRVNLSTAGTVMPDFILSVEKFREAMDWIKVSSAPIVAAQDSILKVTDPHTRARIMLAALAGSQLNNLVSEWVADSRFVLDQLLFVKEEKFVFQALIDSTRIGAMGMSVGGATAGELCKVDPRIEAGINIDGIQYGMRNDVGLKTPFMMIYSMDGAGSNEFLRLYSKNDFHQYTFSDARHADFTDMTYIWPVMRVYGQIGSIPPERMIQLSNSVILNFWDHYLKNQPLKKFDGIGYPELEVSLHFKDR